MPSLNLKQEIIERKGVGHPDTLADALAEDLSVAYSNYTLERFGLILHHNFDKVGILGGKTDVTYGYGKLISPIRILLNGRASTRFANTAIPVRDILQEEGKCFFKEIFGDLVDVSRDLEFQFNVSSASGPGRIRSSKGSRAHLFTPRSADEVRGYDKLVANDTSVGCSYAPLSKFEQTILQIERDLNSPSLKHSFPWLGTDIKILGVRIGGKKSITVCVPQIARYVESESAYKENIKVTESFIHESFQKFFLDECLELFINTRDDFKKSDIYLTAIGSSIESGDEGLVGRGNRINGLITPFRPMSPEGACGKNPVYYVGKLYNVAALNIANRIYEKTRTANEVFLVGQNGRCLTKPWKTIVRVYQSRLNKRFLKSIVEEELDKIPGITQELLKKEIPLY